MLHILAASIWTGGHLVLSIIVLPKAIKERSPDKLLQFESGYEKIGIPAFLIQVITGLYLAKMRVPDIGQWFAFENPFANLVFMKLCLLFITILFAFDARLRIIPRLNRDNMVALAYHIVPVTLVSVLFVVVGVLFRSGGF